MMNAEMKLQIKGLTAVGIILAVAAVIITVFFLEMAQNTLMGASPKYGPHFPAVPATDITQAAQCKAGYDKQWIGCMKLAE
jgi:hypothetical protein